jgi:hypothetical protein
MWWKEAKDEGMREPEGRFGSGGSTGTSEELDEQEETEPTGFEEW